MENKYPYLTKLLSNRSMIFPFSEPDYPKMDSRDCYNFDMTFFGWLYEHMMEFKNTAPIDFSFHTFEVDGKVLTQGECIDLVIKYLEAILKEYKKGCSFLDENKYEKNVEGLFDILKKIIGCMWY